MEVPTAVRVAQMLLWFEGLFAIVFGLVVMTMALPLGILLITVGGLLIGPTFWLGRLSENSRLVVTVVLAIGLLTELVSLFGPLPGQAVFWILVDGVILYCLWWNESASAAFYAGPIEASGTQISPADLPPWERRRRMG